MEGKTFSFAQETFHLKEGFYSINGRKCIKICDVYDMRYATLTINLPSVPLGVDEIIVKTWDENAAIAQAVLELGLFVDTGRRLRTGYVQASVWKIKRADSLQFRDSQTAFSAAIKEGRLSGQPEAENYTGHFMYMGTKDGKDLFKHIMTREYLP